jgi:hypothetical protein
MISFSSERKYGFLSIKNIIFISLIILLIGIYLFSNTFNNKEKKEQIEKSTHENKSILDYNEIYNNLTDIEKNQVLNGKRYTKNGGYKILTLPKDLKKKLINFWEINENKKVKENVDSRYIFSNIKTNKNISNILILQTHHNELYNELNDYIKLKIKEWTNKNDIIHTATYGPREYTNDSVLKEHVDQNSTHILSAIINIRRDTNWPLIIFSNDEKKEEKIIEMDDKNDLVLYESATVIHGRPLPFKGNSYVNIFVHFTSPDWNI